MDDGRPTNGKGKAKVEHSLPADAGEREGEIAMCECQLSARNWQSQRINFVGRGQRPSEKSAQQQLTQSAKRCLEFP